MQKTVKMRRAFDTVYMPESLFYWHRKGKNIRKGD